MKKQAKFGVGIGVIVAAMGFLAWLGYGESKTYYHTIAELETLKGSAVSQRMRIGGTVAVGSIRHLAGRVVFVLEGEGEMCLGDERRIVAGGQLVYIPPGVFHQMTNIGAAPLKMIYCYGPAGDVAHWRQELEGTLPKAGLNAPPLPAGAHPQHTYPPVK